MAASKISHRWGGILIVMNAMKPYELTQAVQALSIIFVALQG